MKIQAKARVQITIEVDGGAPWADDCSIGQLYKQAAETARRNLSNAISANSLNLIIVGEPKVLGIITEKTEV